MTEWGGTDRHASAGTAPPALGPIHPEDRERYDRRRKAVWFASGRIEGGGGNQIVDRRMPRQSRRRRFHEGLVLVQIKNAANPHMPTNPATPLRVLGHNRDFSDGLVGIMVLFLFGC